MPIRPKTLFPSDVTDNNEKKSVAPLRLILLLSIIIPLQTLAAQTSWKGITSTNWATSTNWTNGIPTADIDVIIGDYFFTGPFQPSLTRKSYCKSLTMGNGLKVSTLASSKLLTVGGDILIGTNGTITHSASKISLTGNWTNSGTYNATSTTATVAFSGDEQSISGSSSFKKLIISTGSITTLNTSIAIAKSFTVNGTFDPTLASHLVTLTGSTFIVNAGATIKIRAALFTSNYSITPTTLNRASTVDYASSTVNQNIIVLTYGTLKISGGSIKTPAGNISPSASIPVSGNVNITAGTLDLTNFTINRASGGGGSFTIAKGATLKIGSTNTFPSNYAIVNLDTTSTVEYNGTNQTISNQPYGNLILSSGGGAAVKTMPGTALTVANDLTSSIGTGTSVLYTAGASIRVNGNMTISAATTFNAGSSSHTFYGNFINHGTFTGNSSIITMSGTSKVLAGSGIFNFNDLTIAGFGVTSSAPTISVGGNLATSGAGTFTHNTGGTLLLNGTSKTISGTGFIFDNLTITGSLNTASSFVITGNASVSGAFSATEGTVNLSGTNKTIEGTGAMTFYALQVSGTVSTAISFSMRSDFSGTGLLTATSGTITFIGTSSFEGTHNFYHVTLNGTSLQPGTYSTLGIAGTFTRTAGTFDVTTSAPNTVDYNGASDQNVTPTTYSNLNFSTGGTKTATGKITINNTLTINSSVTFSGGSYTHVLYNHWINNGTFAAGTSTVQLAGTLDMTITGSTTFNIFTLTKTESLNFITLNNNITVATLNMISGELRTGSNAVTITTTRTGNGIVKGTIIRTHDFSTGVPYAFEGPNNTVRLAAINGSINSISVTVHPASGDNFPLDGSINKVYHISVANTGTYTAALRLQYQDTELNGNGESSMTLWRYISAWTDRGRLSGDVTNNWVEQSSLTDISNRWTLSDNNVTAIWKGTTSTAWETASNWKSGELPASTSIIEIGTEAFTNQPLITSSITAKALNFGSMQAATLTLGSGGSLTVNGNIRGDWNANATHTLSVGDQILTVGGDMVLNGGVPFRTIHLKANTGTITIMGSLTQSVDAHITFNGAGSLNIANNFYYSGGTFNAGMSTVTYTGSTSQTVAGITYHHLTFDKTAGIASYSSAVTANGNLMVSTGGIVKMGATLSVAGNSTISTNTTLDANGNILTVGGNWVRNGTFLSSLGSVILNGSGSQSIAPTTFNDLIINKSSGTASPSGNLIIHGNLSISSGTLDLTTYTACRSVVGGTLTLGAGAILKVGGAENFPANFNTNTLSSTGTVEYDGTVAQSIAQVTYGHLVLRNGGAMPKTLTGSITTTGNLTIHSGASMNGGSYTLTLTGDFNNNGMFTPSLGTVVLGGTNKVMNGTTTFNNLVISGIYTSTSNSNLIINGFINLSGSYTAGTNNITLAGDVTLTGTFSCDGTTTLTGTQLQTIRFTGTLLSPLSTNTTTFAGTVSPILNSTTTPTFVNVNISNTGASGMVASVGWIVLGTFTVTSGCTFDGGSLTHTFYGPFVNNGKVLSTGTFIFNPVPPYTTSPATTLYLGSGTSFTSTGSVIFGGSRAVSINGTPACFHDVIISNSNAVGIMPPSDWTINGDLYVNSDAVFHAGTGLSHTLAGNLIVGGTFDGGTSTVILASSDSTVINGSGTITFNHLRILGHTIAFTDFSVSGDFTANAIFDPSDAVITFNGSSSATIGGSSSPLLFETLVINKSWATATLAANLSGLTSLIVSGGAFDVSDYIISEDASGGSLEIAAGATIRIGSTNTLPVFSNGYTFNPVSTVEYSGTTQAVSQQSYGHLVFSNSGTKSFASGTTNIAGDFTIRGTASGNTITNRATIYYNGTTVIQNTPSLTYYNMSIDNRLGTSLGSDITINNSLTFIKGNLITNENKVVLGSSATLSGEGNGKYVVGTLETTRGVGISSNTFGAMGLTIAAGVDDLGDVTVSRKSGSEAAIMSGSRSGINRTWAISITGSQPVSGRSVTFSWISDDDNSKNITQMQLWSRLASGSPWIAMTPSANVSATRSITLSVVHFSDWTATDVASPLPIGILSFTGARITSEQIELRWTNDSEKNSKGFEIQKSPEGISFKSIGFIEAKRNSEEKVAYYFVDNNARDAAYYRLKQLDWDDRFDYSSIINFSGHKETKGVSIYPNPVQNRITVSIDDELCEDDVLNLEIKSDWGVTVLMETGTLEKVNKSLNEKLESLPSRVYFIYVQYRGINYREKFLKM